MKGILVIISLLISITCYAADINEGQTVRGTILSQQQVHNGSTWHNQKGDAQGNTYVIEQDSKNPLAKTTFLFFETSTSTTNLQILNAGVGVTVWVTKWSIIFDDDAATGVWRLCFAADGSSKFAQGYLRTTGVSGVGDEIFTYGTNGIWLTAPRACSGWIQYKTGSEEP